MCSTLKYSTIFGLSFLLLSSCKKDWLEAKSDLSATVPSTIKDFQLLLDNSNTIFNFNDPELGEIGSDNYYVPSTVLQTFFEYERNWYIWAGDGLYNGLTSLPDWNQSFAQVYYSNMVLEGASKIEINSNNKTAVDNIIGSALFYRSFAFYCLASVFSKPFDENTADTDLGIPLRLSSDFNEKSLRASVRQTYDQITNDLKSAIPMLPSLPEHRTRPSKAATYALLARAYLSMAKYDEAFDYADSALQLHNYLLDYSKLQSSALTPFARLNEETIFYSTMMIWNNLRNNRAVVDSNLHASYSSDDLRRTLFFRLLGGLPRFKGSYAQSSVRLFDGLATDEMYLIRAECNARAGNANNAINDLNTLLETRWTPGKFIPMTATEAEDALVKVLEERRKELCFRGLRWTDLRRLNKEDRFKKTLIREVDGQMYTLPPNDPRYVYPIPPDVVLLTNMPQNPR